MELVFTRFLEFCVTIKIYANNISYGGCVLFLCCEKSVMSIITIKATKRLNTYVSFYEPFSNTSKRTITASAFKYFPPPLWHWISKDERGECEISCVFVYNVVRFKKVSIQLFELECSFRHCLYDVYVDVIVSSEIRRLFIAMQS